MRTRVFECAEYSVPFSHLNRWPPEAKDAADFQKKLNPVGKLLPSLRQLLPAVEPMNQLPTKGSIVFKRIVSAAMRVQSKRNATLTHTGATPPARIMLLQFAVELAS